jgi:hypothetical protein
MYALTRPRRKYCSSSGRYRNTLELCRSSKFLLSVIGSQENGTALTVLSALAQQGLDPLEKAQELMACRQREAAAHLATLLTCTPGHVLSNADATVIAERLIVSLHGHDIGSDEVAPRPPSNQVGTRTRKPPRHLVKAAYSWRLPSRAVGHLVRVSIVVVTSIILLVLLTVDRGALSSNPSLERQSGTLSRVSTSAELSPHSNSPAVVRGRGTRPGTEW